jgi:UDP-4-amino-4-deoxy-L-arabinose formyltransferase/UDP-glucuronic acid dehydrogenase (UDP-4-keto-hexauronic acid decarboxylating)
MRIAVLGRTNWLLDSGVRLYESGHEIVLVASAHASPEYRVGPSDFAKFATMAGAVFLKEPDLNSHDVIAVLRASAADIGISVNWPRLIGDEACAAFPGGILNAHAGDLPRYRGNACPNWAIINGEEFVGACVHVMDPPAIDAGPVFSRRRLALNEGTYVTDVYAWLDSTFPEMFSEALSRVLDPAFAPEDQTRSSLMPLRCHPSRPEDGLIDGRAPADRIARLVRASSRPFSGAYSFLEGETRATIWRARVAQLAHEVAAMPGQIMSRSTQGGGLVACGEGVLEIEEAELATGSPLPTANRYRLQTKR